MIPAVGCAQALWKYFAFLYEGPEGFGIQVTGAGAGGGS